MIDFAKIKADTDIVDVIGSLIRLKQKGANWESPCPFHEEKTSSFKVSKPKQMFKCFGCGAQGDVFDFIIRHKGFTHAEAANYITNTPISNPSEVKAKVKERKWTALPIMADTPTPTFSHYNHGNPANTYKYTDESGATLGYTCRFIFPNGEKQVLPYVYATNGNNTNWVYTDFKQPRPLYGLHLLKQYPNADVFLVEGEKTADAINAVLSPELYIAITWPFGSNSVHKTDFKPLQYRNIIYWPDNDCQGLAAMLHVYDIITSMYKWKETFRDEDTGQDIMIERSEPNRTRISFMPLDETLDKGWDAADRNWTNQDDLLVYVSDKAISKFPEVINIVSPRVEKRYGTPIKAWSIKQIKSEEEYYYFGYFSKAPEYWTFFKETDLDEPVKPKAEKKEKQAPGAPASDQGAPPAKIPPQVSQPPVFPHEEYFSILGFEKYDDSLRFFFFIKNTQTICAFSGSGLTKVALLTLAPLHHWETHYQDRNSFDVLKAQNFLIGTCKQMGNFSDKNIRGRGAWVDGKKIIIHTGKDLIINGERHRLGTVPTKYVYELSSDLHISTENPATTRSANKLMTLLKYVNWEREIDAYLFAGWCIIAPFCGVLKWRPHGWLSGAAGTGKSWLLKNVTRKIMGDACVPIQGETTAAGIRQILRRDALPIIFDEAEGEDTNSQQRIQNSIELARASSSDDGGHIIKGSSNQEASSYIIRSCFLFASISDQVAKQADRTRITIFSIKEPTNQAKASESWEAMRAFYHAHCTDEYFSSLQARTIKLLPIIIENAKTFSLAAAKELGQQRTGDQMGALLAGVYSLSSDKKISFEAALRWIKTKDFTEEKNINATKDELQLLQLLMEQVIVVEYSHYKTDLSIGECINIAAGKKTHAVQATDANDALKRRGIKIDDFDDPFKDKKHFIVSNSSQWLRKALKDTAWAKNHNKALLRLPGATATLPTRFAAMSMRAVKIPIEVLG